MNRLTTVLTHTFTQEHSANDIIILGSLPAGATVLSVEMMSQDLNSSLDVGVGYGATSTLSADPTAFSRSLTYAVSGPDLYVQLDGRCQTYADSISVQYTINSATTSCTGQTVHLVIDYVV